MARIGVLTISDRAYNGTYEDRGGPAILAYLETWVSSDYQAVSHTVPDEQDQIEATLIQLADDDRCSLVVTTGGTGPAPRDVTPEATVAVCHKLLPGFGEAMRAVSFPAVPTAILSRQTAGIRNQTLIVNLPGSPKAIAECFDPIRRAVQHCIKLIGGADVMMRPQPNSTAETKKKTDGGGCGCGDGH